MGTELSALRLHAHFDEGSGPAIVMLHGINSDGGDWRTVIDTIGEGYRFIAFDLLGFGRSPKPLDIAYSADEHVTVIENTLLELGVDEPFLLAGYSLGGDIALRYASTHPERVRRLFLLDAPFYLPPDALAVPSSGLAYLYEGVSRRLWDVLARAKSRDDFLYRLATGVAQKPLEDAFHTDDMSAHWEIMSRNLTNTVNAATWVDDLPKLTMPVVHAIGVRDSIVRVSQAPALKRLKPDLEIRKIVGLAADHMVLWNMPERVGLEIMRDEVRELHVAWRGGAGRPLVLLHGLLDSSARWIPAAEILARTYDVAVIDVLGFGDSPAPLSLHYTLADHVSAVLGTVTALWGNDAKVLFAGEGLGGSIALGCAGTAPDRSAGIVAFSPALLEPGSTLEDVGGERAAYALAVREAADRLLERASRTSRNAERVEQELVPLLRSLDRAVLGTDAVTLIEHAPSPITIVVGEQDDDAPVSLLSSALSGRDGCKLEIVPGGRSLPYQYPAAAVGALAPHDAEGIEIAGKASPVSETNEAGSLFGVTSGTEASLIRAGALNLAAALVIAVLHPVPSQLLTVGFAMWVAVASLSAIAGAFGMKRQTKGTRFSFVTTALPTLLAGVGGLLVAMLLFSDPVAARRFFGVSVAVYALLRGASDLYLARREPDVAKPRWLLYAGGLVGVITALAILFGPNHGRGVVRLSLALYLVLTGVSLVTYVVASRRMARQRVSDLLERHAR